MIPCLIVLSFIVFNHVFQCSLCGKCSWPNLFAIIRMLADTASVIRKYSYIGVGKSSSTIEMQINNTIIINEEYSLSFAHSQLDLILPTPLLLWPLFIFTTTGCTDEHSINSYNQYEINLNKDYKVKWKTEKGWFSLHCFFLIWALSTVFQMSCVCQVKNTKETGNCLAGREFRKMLNTGAISVNMLFISKLNLSILAPLTHYFEKYRFIVITRLLGCFLKNLFKCQHFTQ